MTPIQAIKKVMGKVVDNNLKDNRGKKHIPKYKLGHLFRSADIKRVSSKDN